MPVDSARSSIVSTDAAPPPDVGTMPTQPLRVSTPDARAVAPAAESVTPSSDVESMVVLTFHGMRFVRFNVPPFMRRARSTCAGPKPSTMT